MSPTSSTTTRSQRPLTYSSRSPPATAVPQICMTWSSMTTPSAERSLHQFSLRSEKNQRAVDKFINLLTKACCPVSLVLDEFGSRISNVRENACRDSENEQIRILLERQKEQILADYQAEIRKHEFQADYDRRSIQQLNEVIESQRGEIYRAHQGDEQLRRYQQLLHEQLLEQNRELREAHEKSHNEMKELKRFQGSTFDTLLRRRLIEDRDTILELTGKIQELQNEINCMSESRDFKDAESVRSGQSHVTSQPAFFPLFQNPAGMLSRPLGMPSRNNGPPRIWDTHGISGNVFASNDVFFCTPQESNPWISNVSEHTPPHVMSESQTPAQDQRCQSGPSARNSVVLSEGGFSKNYGADQQRLHISDPHFDKFTTSATFACWKIRFKTEVCTCSQFPTEAMLWIKEVELVDSVEELRSSSSVRGIRMPNFGSTRCEDRFSTEPNHP